MTKILTRVMESRPLVALASRVKGFELTPELAFRIRLVLLMSAVLALILAFQVGDDWYVREFANYDWARHMGY